MGDFFFNFVDSMRTSHLVDKNNKIVLKTGKINRDGYVIKGIINFGDYGYSAQGFNVIQNKFSYDRSSNDSELTPHYFLVYLPDNLDIGIVLLQRFGAKGIFTDLKKMLSRNFTEKFPNYRLTFDPQVPIEVINYLRDGSLKSIRITKYAAPSDITNTFIDLGFTRQEGVLITEFKAKKRGILSKPDWLKNLADNKSSSFYEVNSEDIPSSSSDEIQISVDYLGKLRTIRFDNSRKISPYIDATDALEITPSGHPSFNSMDSYCENLLDQLLREMGSQRHVQ